MLSCDSHDEPKLTYRLRRDALSHSGCTAGIFDDAERLFRRLKKPRSQIYGEAVTEDIAGNDPEAVTEARSLNSGDWIALSPHHTLIGSGTDFGAPILDSKIYRITRSARASTFCGIVRPICLAVFRLMTNSNLVGCSTGKSAGLNPLRILST